MLGSRSSTLMAGLALVTFVVCAAYAADRRDRSKGHHGDHDGARRAFQQGQIRSLSELLTELRSQLDGEVIEVDLERKGGTYVYEFKVLSSDGRVREVKVDAATGKILKSEFD